MVRIHCGAPLTTADRIDPFHGGALGNFANYRGGRAQKHDLGVEFDAGLKAGSTSNAPPRDYPP